MCKWLKNITKKIEWYDISLIKLSTFLFALFLITAWAGFRDFVMGFEWYWYLILAVVVALPPMKRVFCK